MALVIDGNGDITGLTTGAIESSAIGSGAVRQVVSSTYSTSGSTTSTSYVSIGLTATITPTSSSSKILIISNCPVYTNTAGSYSTRWTVFRGTTSGTNLGESNIGFGPFGAYYGTNSGVYIWGYMSLNYLDTPSTTSAQVYTLATKIEGNGIPSSWCTGNTPAVLTLMEIA